MPTDLIGLNATSMPVLRAGIEEVLAAD